LRLLEAAAASGVAAMDALRMAADTITLQKAKEPLEQPLALLANFPAIVAAYANLRQGRSPVKPHPELGLAGNYLYMLRGSEPSSAHVRALQTYLITVVDHGLNASTFTARTIVSTESDLISAVIGAVGALKGPRHGGAPGPVLEMIQSIDRPEEVEPALRARLERGERLMGFGHRVYKVRDPRAQILSEATADLYAADEGRNAQASLYALARQVEKTAIDLLQDFKPGRNLQTNVEFYTALLLHGLGLDTDLFSPTFAIGRLAGWIGHCLEQRRAGRMIRPQARYTGERDRRWIPLDRRQPQ
jgi:citrate synthase